MNKYNLTQRNIYAYYYRIKKKKVSLKFYRITIVRQSWSIIYVYFFL